MQKLTFILSYIVLNMCIALHSQNTSGVDLTITEFSTKDKEGFTDDYLYANICSKNLGNVLFNRKCITIFYLSSDTVLDKNVDLGIDAIVNRSLDSNSTSCAPIAINLKRVKKPGLYYLIAEVDANHSITELREDNNTKVLGPIPIHIRNFELQLDSLVLETEMTTNRQTMASVVVQNVGLTTSTGYYWALYFSTDTIYGSEDIYMGGATQETEQGISAGSSAKVVSSCDPPLDVVPGDYYIIAILYVIPPGEGQKIYDQLIRPLKVNAPSPPKEIQLRIDSIYANKPVLKNGENFSLTALVTNIGAERSEYHEVVFYLSNDSLLDESKDPQIGWAYANPPLDTGKSALFTCTFSTLPDKTALGSYYVFARSFNTEGDPIVVGSAKTRVTVGLRDTDLKIASQTVANASQLHSGSAVSITTNILNNGSDASVDFSIEYYLSKDSLLNGADQKFTTRYAAGVGAYKSSDISTSATLPVATVGQYYIISKIVVKALTEKDSTNNVYKTAINIILPNVDLRVESVSGTLLTYVTSSNRLEVTVTEKNFGTTLAKAHDIGYYLSQDAVWSVGDISIGTVSVGSIAGGTSSTYSNTLLVDNTVKGSYYLIAKTNPSGVVTETNTTNNTKAYATMLNITTPNVDLYLSSFTINKTSFKQWENVDLVAKLKNLGTSNSGGFQIRYILSTDTIFDDNKDIFLGFGIGGLLTAKDSLIDSNVVFIPEDRISGQYYLMAYLNDNKAVIETNRANNQKFIPIYIEGNRNTDLKITSQTVANAHLLQSASAVSITTHVLNNGSDASNSYTMEYYLSSDSLLDALDQKFNTYYGSALGAYKSSDINISATLPTVSGGQYYIISNILFNAVAENNFANNVYKTPVTILPAFEVDLYLKSLTTTKTTFQQGESVDIVAKVKNLGTSDAGGFFIDYVISPDTIPVNGNDVFVSNTVPKSLNANDSIVDHKTFSIPNDLETGNYYLFALVNYDELVSETNRNNNNLMIPIAVGVVTNLSSESTDQVTHIYPNPSTGTISVSFLEGGHIEVYDLDNRLVRTQSVSGTTISLESLPNGIYQIRGKSGGKLTFGEKLVICR